MEKVFKFTPLTLFPRQEPPHPLLGGWVSPRSSQDWRKKSCPCWDSNALPSSRQPTRLADRAITACICTVETTKTFHSYSCMQALMGFDTGSLKVKGCWPPDGWPQVCNPCCRCAQRQLETRAARHLARAPCHPMTRTVADPTKTRRLNYLLIYRVYINC
jgi:hypothetical protein